MGNRTAKNFKRAVDHYKKRLLGTDLMSKSEVLKMRSVINSYLGLLMHYKTYNLRHKTLFKDLPCAFYKYGYFSVELDVYKLNKD
ncbi:hypothetical protein CMT57_06435 [Elizabethkingia anophelis]|nr:hypothetical protein [Elizabethkingia anophelis]